MPQKTKRINLTISEKYSLMDEIITDCRKKGLSVSDYLCQCAIKDYQTSKQEEIKKEEKKSNYNNILGIPLGELFNYMKNVKPDIASEVIRLFNNNTITAEKAAEVYLGIRASSIQLDNTAEIKKILDITKEDDLIYSKRDTMSSIAISRSKGLFIDRLSKIKEKQDVEKRIQEHRKQQAEKRKLDLEQWRKEHPGIDDYYFDIPEDQWDEFATPEEMKRYFLDGK